VFEAVKGLAALAVSLGLLGLLRHDLRGFVAGLIEQFGLDPGQHYPSIFLHYADMLARADLRSLVLLATAYVTLRFAEAYGLWRQRVWGEWLGALSGALYVPFELHHLMREPTMLGATVLVVNLAVVAYLAFMVWSGRRHCVP
jgi:uncharacterized membrane protein (DUF2068 family)